MVVRSVQILTDPTLPQAPEEYSREYIALLVSAIEDQQRIFNAFRYMRPNGMLLASTFPRNPLIPDALVPDELYENDGFLKVVGSLGSPGPGLTMKFRDPYNFGTLYYIGDTVVDGVWTMVCVAQFTIERAAPQAVGPSTFVLPTTPAWAIPTFIGTVSSGHEYTITTNGVVTQIRVWAPAVSGTITHRLFATDETDPANPVVIAIPLPPLVAGVWTDVASPNLIFESGTVFKLFLETSDSSGTTNWAHEWAYEGVSNNDDPLPGNWNRRNQNDTVRIDEIDDNDVDQSTDLDLIISGSILRFAQTSDLGNFWEYAVNFIIKVGSTYTADVVLVDSGGVGVPVGATTTITATIPTPQSTDYVELAGAFPGLNPTWGTVTGELALGGTVQVVPTNAYGVDISFQPGTTSADWRALALSG